MTGHVRLLAPDVGVEPGARESLETAVGTVLNRLRPGGAVTLLVNDPQRATSSSVVLERMRERLAASRLRALVATGTHHFPSDRRRRFECRLRTALPLETIAWHDADSPDLVEVGGRHPWRGHRWLLDEDWDLLAIGSCEPHYFAGITGAHKTATIGCAARGDVEANHSRALSSGARPVRLAGNPVHEGIAAMVAGLTARREVVVLDLLQAAGEVLAASAGSPLEALREIAPRVRATYVRRIQAPADALLLEVEGPLGRSFYQADKAIKNNEWAVRDGGCLVLLAPCPDGIGQDHFMHLLRQCRTHALAETTVARRGYRLGDHKAVKLRYLTDRRGVRVFAVSEGLADEDCRLLGFAPAASAEAALSAAGVNPHTDAVFRVADAGNTCVTVEPD